MSGVPATVRVYTPDRQRGLGISAYAEMVRELWGARELLARFVWRDIRLRTRVAFLGLFWSMLQPLGMAAVFVYLRGSGLLRSTDEGAPYPLYVYLGILHWNLFANMITHASGSLVGASNLVAKVAFPREVLVLSGCARAGFDWLCGLPALIGLFIWYGYAPHAAILLAPLALLPLVLVGVGLGLLLSVVALPVRDVIQALPIVLLPCLFLTPVLYALPDAGAWALLDALNPIASALNELRALAFAGAPHDPLRWALWTLGALLLLLAAWRFFRVLMTRVPEYA